MGDYPAINIGLIGTAVGSVVTLLVAFGIPITPEQTQAILGAVASFGPIVTGLVIYLERRRQEARREPPLR